MICNTLFKLSAAVLLCSIAVSAYCQEKAPGQSSLTLLVMLNSEQNKLHAAEHAKRYKDLEEIKKDAASVMAATKSDFSAHFKQCPVYYFVDTNLAQIKSGSWSNILYTADGTPATKASATTYYITYYGYPQKQNNEGALQKGLVIENEHLEQVHFERSGLWNNSLPRKEKKKAGYTSKHFGIEYRPIASTLNDYFDGR
jgi:hypothetical protein